jgi:hypothetical protein
MLASLGDAANFSVEATIAYNIIAQTNIAATINFSHRVS